MTKGYSFIVKGHAFVARGYSFVVKGHAFTTKGSSDAAFYGQKRAVLTILLLLFCLISTAQQFNPGLAIGMTSTQIDGD